jgi:hypothetical protein
VRCIFGLAHLGQKIAVGFLWVVFFRISRMLSSFFIGGLGSLWFFVLLDFDVFLWVADFDEVVFDSVAVVALEHD